MFKISPQASFEVLNLFFEGENCKILMKSNDLKIMYNKNKSIDWLLDK